MIEDSTATDIVYTDVSTGRHGNYLRGSIEASGLGPDALPDSHPTAIDFTSGGKIEAKVWRDIWGAGNRVGGVDAVRPTADVVERLANEYKHAGEQLAR
ncbi:hypothetical protein ACFWAY_45885 [Rhodococcus sp. NPDC059968]|uniref:hypothetical protein n=1 Tax=Rhodococcus sp. NPDC059968 TaxID=3347017 RepID=UPI00366B7CA8